MPLEPEGAACANDNVKSSSEGTVKSNAPLDVPIVVPEDADASSGSKATEQKSSWTACMRPSMRQAHRQDRDVFPKIHGSLPISRDGKSLAGYRWSHLDKHGKLVTVLIRLEDPGGSILCGCIGSTRSQVGNVETPGS